MPPTPTPSEVTTRLVWVPVGNRIWFAPVVPLLLATPKYLAGEMTLKRFRRLRNGRAALQAENPDFPEFVIGEEAPAEIWGVVVGVVRKLR